MAKVHGKGADFTYNAVAIEDELNSITQNSTVAEAEITSFGDVYQNYLAGKPNHTYDISGALDTAAAQGHKTLFAGIGAGAKTTIFSPDAGTTTFTSTASGLTGSLISAYTINLPVGDAAKYSATLQVSSALSRAQP